MSSPTRAEKLLMSLGIAEPGEIDLEAIAMHCNAVVRYQKLEGCEARIVGSRDQAIITVDSNSDSRRKRFSIGHELGHWHYHRGKCLDCRGEDIRNGSMKNRNGLEKTANRFAADLLLPLYLFQPISDQIQKANFDAISKIAMSFDVSLMATAIRYVEYGLLPTILVYYDQNCHRLWFVRNDAIPESLFPRQVLNKYSGAFEVLVGKDNRTRRLDCSADIWFDSWGAEKFLLQEETVRVGQNGVLTLLTWDNEEMLLVGE